MPSLNRSIWWSFTLNSKISPQDILVIPEDLPSYDTLVSFFESSDLVRFCQYSHEFETRHHLQGVFQLKSVSTLKGVKNCLPSPWCDFVHCEPLKLLKNDKRSFESMIDDCIAYTEKEETHVSGPYVYGLRVKKGSNSGKVADACKRSPDRMQLESPKEFRRFVAKESVDDFNEKFEFNHELRPWQIELEKLLVLPADDRMVIWVFGEKGNEGKSTYAKKMSKEGWYYTRGGKSDNVIYDWVAHHKKNIVFDIPRSQKEFTNFGLLENLKDGMVLSTKYEPLAVKRYDAVHIVVMANFLPKSGEDLSEDRLKVLDCEVIQKKYSSMGLVKDSRKRKNVSTFIGPRNEYLRPYKYVRRDGGWILSESTSSEGVVTVKVQEVNGDLEELSFATSTRYDDYRNAVL